MKTLVMMIIMLLGIFLISSMVMFLYCCFAEKMDQHYFAKRRMTDSRDQQEINTDTEQIFENGRRTFVHKAYNCFNSYMYGLMRYNLMLVGKIPSHTIRRFLYKYIYRMKITKKTVIYGGCEIRSPWNIKIGNAVIAVGCILDGREKITIGDNVVFGSNVHLWTEEHNMNDPWFRVLSQNSQPIVIEDRAWICSDSTILPGIHVKEGSVVAARACVTKDCEAFTVYGGVPAKKIGERNRDLCYELSGKPTWHFF